MIIQFTLAGFQFGEVNQFYKEIFNYFSYMYTHMKEDSRYTE